MAMTPDSESPRTTGRARSVSLRLIALPLGAMVLVLVILWHHRIGLENAAAARRAGAGIPVIAVTAQRGDITVHLDAIGTVTPVYTVSIASQVSGPVVAVDYREGQLVRKGDSLIEIDPRPYQALLMQAQGILERDQNLLAQARMDLVRYRAALARNAVAEQTVDDQEKLVLQVQGTVRNDEGTVRYDALQVEYCHIRAPISGRIGLRLVDPGNLVQANGSTALAVITQLQPITVIFTLSEDSLGAVLAELRAGRKLAVDVFDRTAQTLLESGELTALDNQIDTTTGTARLRATFENHDGALFPNQFVNVQLRVRTVHDAILVPSSTVQQNGPNSYVYVLQNGVAHQRAVRPGVTDGGRTQIDGVSPGEMLADSSFDKLQDQAPVRVTTHAAAPASGGAAGGSAAAAR